MENEAVGDLQMDSKSMKIMKNHIKSHEIHVEKYENSKNPSRIIQDTPETCYGPPGSFNTRFPDFDPGCFFIKKNILRVNL